MELKALLKDDSTDIFGQNGFVAALFAPVAVAGPRAALAAAAAAPTTRVVTTGADSGVGSLRSVLAAAQAGDTITFALNVTQVTLASTLTCNTDVIISGAGRSTLPKLAGTGALVVGGNDQIGGIALASGFVLRNNGTMKQIGDVTLGDGSGGVAKITNAAGSTWALSNHDLLAGDGDAVFNNAGTLAGGFNTDESGTVKVSIVNNAGTPGVISNPVQPFYEGPNNDFYNQSITGYYFTLVGGRSVIDVGTGITAGTFLVESGAFVVLNEDVGFQNRFNTYTATVDLNGHAFLTSGAVSFYFATFVGNGKFIASGAVAIGDSSRPNSLIVGGGAVARFAGATTQYSDITIGDASNGAAQITNAPGATWAIAGDLNIVGGNAKALFNNAGTLDKTQGTGTTTVGARFDNLSGGAASVTIDSGTILFNAAAGNRFVGEAIGGDGTFGIAGGGLNVISAGTTIATSAWTLARSGTVVRFDEDLSFAGSFTDTNATTLDLGTHILSLNGAVSFVLGVAGAPAVSGSGKLILAAGASLGGLTLGGSVLLRVNGGTVDQTGAVTLGDASGGAARLTVAAGATWALDGDVGIAAGNANVSINLGGGALNKTAGAGKRSVVSADITNLSTSDSVIGTVRAQAGKLELAGRLSGNLDLRLTNQATLLVDKAAGAGVWAYLSSGTTLQLNDAPDFAGQINGFTAGNSNLDLRSIGYGANTAATAQGKVLTITDGTRTAHLNFSNTLNQDSLHIASDGMAGTLVTYG